MVRLIPTDRTFFGMLTELAVRNTSAATLLCDLFENPDQKESLVRLIREDEHQADEIAHKITLRLGTSFVPPLDAQDIYELAGAIDDTIDLIEDAASRVECFRLRSVDGPTQRLGEIMRRCASTLEQAVRGLEESDEVVGGVSEVWRLEEEGDAVYGEAIVSLFGSSEPAVELLKRKELYDVMEEAIDHSKDVAEILTSIAVKQS